MGVNRFGDEAEAPISLHRTDPAQEVDQVARLVRFRSTRDGEAAGAATRALGEAARGTENLIPFILRAVKARATLGEIADALRAVCGEYRPS